MEKSLEEQMEELSEMYFRSGYNCAESVVNAASDLFDPEDVFLSPRLGSGFARGMGDGKGLCGAINGGALVIGALIGRDNPLGSDDAANRAVLEFTRKFESELGCKTCKDLIKKYRTKMMLPKCGWISGRAAAILTKVLIEHNVQPNR